MGFRLPRLEECMVVETFDEIVFSGEDAESEEGVGRLRVKKTKKKKKKRGRGREGKGEEDEEKVSGKMRDRRLGKEWQWDMLGKFVDEDGKGFAVLPRKMRGGEMGEGEDRRLGERKTNEKEMVEVARPGRSEFLPQVWYESTKRTSKNEENQGAESVTMGKKTQLMEPPSTLQHHLHPPPPPPAAAPLLLPIQRSVTRIKKSSEEDEDARLRKDSSQQETSAVSLSKTVASPASLTAPSKGSGEAEKENDIQKICRNIFRKGEFDARTERGMELLAEVRLRVMLSNAL